ncbi:MAG: rod shape-determining protein RodA [Alphaproteobacteria bacterium]|nr:rod shape-determining protein RodA [Alphaproteobacteria bacterium]HCQ71749.1 rod shape-determining protein RodA [Rhodospirillaceae bacterium]|tara:strand:+ start:15209 stop:16333 length:1125 start_codon:yes stop_codon:yes gene_type:complete
MSIRIEEDRGLLSRLQRINWLMIGLITALASIGFACLYSAAGGSLSPWASRQMMRFAIGLGAMLFIAMMPTRFWFRMAWPCYAAGLVLLLIVEVMGHIGMGAQRWINLGFINLQPSEVMKIAVIMVLARYYHLTSRYHVSEWHSLITPAIIVFAPVCLVMFQPDLGTALMIIMGAAAMVFIAGAPFRWFAYATGAVIAIIPLAWHFMHDYQKKRVMTFLNPESDPLGAGYHIMQSKIALGSGGISGKGFLEGSQSRLNFLPEKQTDFIFTLWVEEWGLIGGLALLLLCGIIFIYGVWIALQCKNKFSRYLTLGLMINFSLYVFINTGMVMGLLPVVGVPLPLVSYGGTSMLSCMIAFGLIMSCEIDRSLKIKAI